jgi:hypothetical protein
MKTWLGFAALFGAYVIGYYGYVLVKGYNISFSQVIDPVNYYTGGKPSSAGPYSGSGIFPSGPGSTGSS